MLLRARRITEQNRGLGIVAVCCLLVLASSPLAPRTFRWGKIATSGHLDAVRSADAGPESAPVWPTSVRFEEVEEDAQASSPTFCASHFRPASPSPAVSPGDSYRLRLSARYWQRPAYILFEARLI